MLSPEITEQLRWATLLFASLIICVTLHEFAHAWMADKRGDPLPRLLNRVTLDPRAHIDPIGTLFIPAIMIYGSVALAGMPLLFGWGKPVPISLPNPKTRKWDDILTSLAGPGMNLLLAILGTLIAGTLIALHCDFGITISFLILFIKMNLILMVFNLFPLPPLDGSRVLFYLVKMKQETFEKLARNAWWIMLLALNLPSPGNSIISKIFHPLLHYVSFPFMQILEIISKNSYN